MQWYYALNGQQNGPIGEEDLRKLIQDGGVKPGDLVWNETMGEQWQAASSVAGLCPESVLEAVPAEEFCGGTGGMTENAALMAEARGLLSGNWGNAIGVTVVYYVVMVGVQILPYVGGLISWIIAGPLVLGLMTFFLALARGGDPDIGELFDGFKRFGTSLGAYLLMTIFVLLWMILLIIPGIIAAYAYSQTFFIIAEDPNIGPLSAIKQSKEMMRGMKWKRFCLDMRFIGWSLLALLTCGIGYLWLGPYMTTSYARFYDDLKPAIAGPTEA